MNARQLHKHGLKVVGYDFVHGKEWLSSIEQDDSRRYSMYGPVEVTVRTTQGNLHVATAGGFVFDGRSGPKIVDWYAPNLGTLEERLAWFVHDCNGYGLDLSFEDTNLLLYAMLRDLAKYRTSKAALIQFAVGLSRSWYGEPKEGEWCRCNAGKVNTVWIPKET